MSALIYILDPISLKESILITLEVYSNNRLKEWAKSIPSVVGRTCIEVPRELEESLISCIEEFKKTKTYLYLREDFKNSLYNIELQLKNKAS
jgi:hypothetical protein